MQTNNLNKNIAKANIQQQVQHILSQLTLTEKASLCSGKDFWHLEGIERLNVPSIMITDGPHGLRKQQGASDHLGLSASVKSTCFPTAVTLASSWDMDLIHQVGETLATEALHENVGTLLGPGMNIKRNPLCGRNFEYFSEDPFLTGRLATSFVNGVQSKGVGTSVKHFAVNNQEKNRMTIDTIVDERTMREIYLAGFEDVVKNAQPWTVMCAYNKVNGTFCSDHNLLLNEILREEWGFEGLVVTDWGAMNDRVKGLEAGLDLEMPGCAGINDRLIIKAIDDGSLDIAVLDRIAQRVLELILKSQQATQLTGRFKQDSHHQLAREAAAKSMVLLKNEHTQLPLSKTDSCAIIGDFAETPRYQGAGSSQVTPTKITNLITAVKTKLPAGSKLLTSKGYDSDSAKNAELIAKAVEVAKQVNNVVIMVGLPNSYESEAFDRDHLNLPKQHNDLVAAVAAVNENITVVLSNGSPVLMPWLNQVNAVLEGYLGGQASGEAIADLLFGDITPSGKLAETFPLSLADSASSANFPGLPKQVVYKEGLNVGYRHFDNQKTDVLFPFGFGLSYTEFAYSDCQVVSQDDYNVTVEVIITNTGSVPGSEIVQLYVEKLDSKIHRAQQELKAFKKVALAPQQSKTVTLKLDRRCFAFFSSQFKEWQVEAGEYRLNIAASSRDIRSTLSVKLTGDYVSNQLDEMARDVVMTNEQYVKLLGHAIPKAESLGIFHFNSTLEDIETKWVGRLVNKKIAENMSKQFGSEKPSEETLNMVKKAIMGMPLRSLVLLGGGKLDFRLIDAIVMMLNGQYFKLLKMKFGR